MSVSSNSVTSSVFVRWLPLVAFCAVVAHHLWFVSSYAVNIPRQDDIFDFLNFVNQTEAAASTADAIKEWYSQYNDHRTNASRLVVYATYLIEGEVNFHTLTIIGNLALPLILLLFYFCVRDQKYRWVWLLSSALLLLHIRTYSIVIFSQANFAYYYVFLYAFASFVVVHNVTPTKFMLAAVLCALSSWTLASGQIAWLLCLVSLLQQSLVTRNKPILYPVIWLVVAIGMIIAWQIGFRTPATLDVQIPFPDSLTGAPLFQILERYVLFFLATLGSAFYLTNTAWAAATGLFILIVLSILSIRFYKHEDMRLVLCCWFIVASAAAITVGRAIFLPPSYSLLTRYSLLSVLLTSAIVLLIQSRFAVFKTATTYLIVVLAGGYWYWAHSEFEQPLQKQREYRITGFNNGLYPMFGKRPGETQAVVEQSIRTGIYKPPCKPFPACQTTDF